MAPLLAGTGPGVKQLTGVANLVSLGKMTEETNIDKATGDAWPKLLSPRERQIAMMIARGLSNRDVACKLGLSDGTVKLHVHRILRKLGAKSRYSLIVQAGTRSFHK